MRLISLGKRNIFQSSIRRSVSVPERPLSKAFVSEVCGEVRMNNEIVPGSFSSKMGAWLDSHQSLRDRYGKSLDVFQLLDEQTEKAGAAVLRCQLSVASSQAIPCFFVYASASKSYPEMGDFREQEAISFAVSYAEKSLQDEGRGIVLYVKSDESPKSSSLENFHCVADFVEISFSFLRPTLSQAVKKEIPGPQLSGLFSSFNFISDFESWRENGGNENSTMWLVQNGDVVLGGVTVLKSINHEIILTSPFLTEHAENLEIASRMFEILCTHVLAENNVRSGRLIFDKKDPFAGFAGNFLKKLGEIKSSNFKILGIPLNLNEKDSQAILNAPFQFSGEMQGW